MWKLVLLLQCLFAWSAYGQGISSCVGRCDDYVDHSYTCQCNSHCDSYGDCCDDYVPVCIPSATCDGRCDTSLDSSRSCQCNSACTRYGDCCSDYDALCNGGTGGSSCASQSISNDEILTISEELWRLDENKASASDVITNPQATTSSSSTVDNSPEPFYTQVNPEVLERPTFKALIALLDNYEKVQGINEQVTGTETTEISNFLDLVLETNVGKLLYEFLDSKGRAGCNGLDTFKSYLQMMWFDFYSRKNGAMDTSGFEHAFVGEIKSNDVSGFHNWVQFYRQESIGALNYYGYVSTLEPRLYSQHFTWDGHMKPIGGGAVGVSPEVELALFTLCHMARPNSRCSVRLLDNDGYPVIRDIQTYTWSNSSPGNGLSYVASSYFLS